jgi:hypothetical protein
MIKSNRKYPFGTIITLMRAGEIEFAISTAKEGVFKGLTTYVQIPVHNLAAKIFYIPSMNKQAIHFLHEKLVLFIEEQLNEGHHLPVIIDFALKMIKEDGYALEIVTADWFKDLLSQKQNETYETPNDDWVFVLDDKPFTWYYKKSSVDLDDKKNIYIVLVKQVYTKQGRIEISGDGDADIGYSLIMYHIDCKKRECNMINMTFYSQSGDELFSEDLEPNWKKIKPNDYNEALLMKLLEDNLIDR